MHIDVMDGGEFHIGSPECRYQGKLDMEMFGTRAEQIEHEETVHAVFSAPEGNYLDNPIIHSFVVHLGGERLEYKMQLDLRTLWDKNGDYSHSV